MAIGDASNDVAMFDIATIAVGVANSDDAVRASGVQLTTASFGSGVAEALRRHLPRSAAGLTFAAIAPLVTTAASSVRELADSNRRRRRSVR